MSEQCGLFGHEQAPAGQRPKHERDQVKAFREQVAALIEFYRDRRPKAQARQFAGTKGWKKAN